VATTPTAVNVARLGALLIALLLVVVACGGARGSDVLSPEAENGRKIAINKGCAACHGDDGSGPIGPAFKGLYGSNVTLTDGSTVVADDEYLRRSIVDPSAQLTDGYTLKMPETELSDEDIEAVLAYIRELGPQP
jgi:cytochrome c oxidase subunit II